MVVTQRLQCLFIIVGFFLVFASTLRAQTLPVFDPAITLPDLTQPMFMPPPATDLNLQGSPLLDAEPGGRRFTLTGLVLVGNTQFSDEILLEKVADQIGLEVDFAGLQEITNRLSQFYRIDGFPFARAYLPEQDVTEGLVVVEVLEGIYGSVQAVQLRENEAVLALVRQRDDMINRRLAEQGEFMTQADEAVIQAEVEALLAPRFNQLSEQVVITDSELVEWVSADAFLRPLKPGRVIRSDWLERVALIVDDIPGFTTVPVIRPSQQLGAGDLEMRLTETPRLRVSLRADNHGSEASGRYRARVDTAAVRNFVWGDEFQFTGLLTDGQTWLTTFNYSFPLNSSGLRLEATAQASGYALKAGDFADLASGSSQQAGLRITYPLQRSQSFNFSLQAGVQWTQYTNELADDRTQYRLVAVPLGLTFDWRDEWLGRAATFGGLTLEQSRLHDDGRASPPESSFAVLTLNLTRIQVLSARWQASGRWTAQFSGQAVDNSRFISLAGANAVRAFPVGEFSGARGNVFQAELSYSLPNIQATPYGFVDAGQALSLSPDGVNQRRTLSGFGAGIRYRVSEFTLDASAALPWRGGDSVVEPDRTGPTFWLTSAYSF